MAEYICPHCGKPIYDDEALLCLYCGESLNRGVGFLGRVKYPAPKVITAIIVILVLSGFVLWVTK
ncbi:zinc ribbon domain-containing protein [Candidatus Omnitrophota bacterium]